MGAFLYFVCFASSYKYLHIFGVFLHEYMFTGEICHTKFLLQNATRIKAGSYRYKLCVCVCVLTVYITLTQAVVQDNFSLAEIDCYNSCMVDAGIVSRVRSTTRVQVDVPNACAMCM